MAETATEQMEREKLSKLLRFLEHDITFGERKPLPTSEKPSLVLSQRVKTFSADKSQSPSSREWNGGSLLMPISIGRFGPPTQTVVGGTPITMETATQLRTLVYGSCHHSFSREWQKSSLAFQHVEGNFPYGLITHRCGSRGLTLCVQAFLIKHLVFGREYQSSSLVASALEPNGYERRRALIGALSEVLWQAGDSRRCCVCLLQDEDCFEPNYHYRNDKITERLHLFQFRKLVDVKIFIKRHLEQFQGDNGCGCILFLYSVVLSRSVYRIRQDLDLDEDSKVKLLSDMEECSQALINLLLTGRAFPFLHNGDVLYDRRGSLLSHPIRGCLTRGEVGFLFWNKGESNDNRTEIGSMLKTPRYPVWLTHVNGQFGLLFSTNPDLVNDWRAEHRFTLIYYTGLVSQEKTTYLAIDTRLGRTQARTSIISRYEDDKIPALEHCIMTKWYGANVSWNGVFPFY